MTVQKNFLQRFVFVVGRFRQKSPKTPLLLLACAASLCASSCKPDKSKNAAPLGNEILARAGNATLSRADVAELLPTDMTPADSVAFVRQYAESWVRRQLLLAKASQAEADNDEIDRKVDDYRQHLVLQAFEQGYAAQYADTNVTDAEIKAYHQTNPDNFLLQQSIARAFLVAVPKNTPQLERAKAWMRSRQPRDRQELQSFCYRFASFYHLQDSVWVTFDELVRNTPFREETSPARLLRNGTLSETADQQNVYLLAVKDHRLPGQSAPLPFVEPKIREILFSRRKVKVLRDLENQLFEEARRRNEIDIRVK